MIFSVEGNLPQYQTYQMEWSGVELHWEGFAPVACAVGLYYTTEADH